VSNKKRKIGKASGGFPEFAGGLYAQSRKAKSRLANKRYNAFFTKENKLF
jgi:hypothetical protein